MTLETPYRPYIDPATGKSASGGGYVDKEIREGVYEVEFQPNGHTKKQKTEDFTLLRAAEITLLNGMTHFKILDWDRGITSYSKPANFVEPTITTTWNVSKMEIEILNKPKTNGSEIYDAKKVFGELKLKYELDKLVEPEGLRDATR